MIVDHSFGRRFYGNIFIISEDGRGHDVFYPYRSILSLKDAVDVGVIFEIPVGNHAHNFPFFRRYHRNVMDAMLIEDFNVIENFIIRFQRDYLTGHDLFDRCFFHSSMIDSVWIRLSGPLDQQHIIDSANEFNHLSADNHHVQEKIVVGPGCLYTIPE